METINPSTHRPYAGPVDAALTDAHITLLSKIQNALAAIQSTILPDDLPPAGLHKSGPRFLDHFQGLSVSSTPARGFYDINLLEGYIRFGVPMLETLGALSDAELERFTGMFILHETLHIDQSMYSSTHHGISHASIVLEEMDYFADAFAMAASIAWRIRVNPDARTLRDIIKDYALLAIRGMEVFDQTASPTGMSSINEARLRRYLIWHTQYVRLLACRSMADVHRTLFPRICVEIEPTRGEFDEFSEKAVRGCADNALLFISLGGMLVRQPSMQGFDIPTLYAAILSFDHDSAWEQLRYVVMQNHAVLAPEL